MLILAALVIMMIAMPEHAGAIIFFAVILTPALLMIDLAITCVRELYDRLK